MIIKMFNSYRNFVIYDGRAFLCLVVCNFLHPSDMFYTYMKFSHTENDITYVFDDKEALNVDFETLSLLCIPRAPDKVCIFISKMPIFLPNPMFDHLLQ